MSITDQVMPDSKWEFDKDVTDVFDNMLERSIPQYNVMRQTCFDLGCKFVQHKTDIVDLGCSKGEALAPFITKFGAYNHYIGIEVSQPMIEASKERFKGYIKTGVVDIQDLDLRYTYPACQASLTLAILTIQFTPIEYRLRLLNDIYENTISGGALIFVEKVLGSNAVIDKTMVDLYYKMKSDNGYTQDQIDRKKLSLEGVLVPVTAKWNEELLQMAGFKYVDCFWRWMNFAGWIAIK